MKYITTVNQREYIVEVLDDHRVIVDGVVRNVDYGQVGDQPVFSFIVDGQSFEAHVYPDELNWQILLRGEMYPASVEDERERRLRMLNAAHINEQAEFHLKAPMPGMVVSVPVDEGQTVERGQVLLVLESMKMQNELRSPKAGTVARLRVKPGDRVEQKQTMLSVV